MYHNSKMLNKRANCVQEEGEGNEGIWEFSVLAAQFFGKP